MIYFGTRFTARGADMSQYTHTGQSPHDRPQRNYVVALLLSFFLGGLGVDRFYLGHIGLGVTKLLLNGFITIITLGLGGWIWWLIDFIMIATRNVKNDTFVWDDEVQQPHQQAPYQYPGNPGQPFHGAPGQSFPQQPQAPQGTPGQSTQQAPYTPYAGPGMAAPAQDATQPVGSWQQWEAPADNPTSASPVDDTPVAPGAVETPASAVDTPPPAPAPEDTPVHQEEFNTPTIDSTDTPPVADTVEPVDTSGTTDTESTTHTLEQHSDDSTDETVSADRDDRLGDQGAFPWKQQ